MNFRMLSLENISTVQSAIFICLSPEVKKEILCIPGSEYDACKLKYEYYRKEQWVETVERKAKEILERRLPEKLCHKLISIVPAMAFRILIWAKYHEGMLGLTRYYTFNFLRLSHFTLQGVIDDKKAAEDMIMDINLSIEQRYKLACFYCFEKYISSFFRKIVRNKENTGFEPENSKCMDKPEIVKYWTCQLTVGVDECSTNISRYPCKVEESIKSGSKEAVKFFLEETCLISREYPLIYGATEVLNKINVLSDWIVFRDKKFDDRKEAWVPNYFYIDILCFFLSNMTESQQRKALENNIQIDEMDSNGNDEITVLELFLLWPYQDYFMKTAALLWDIMPKRRYAILLLKICDMIEPCKRNNLLYREERGYDYRTLLMDFWIQSPDHFKRYVFTDCHVIYDNGRKKTTSAIGLLLKLISLKTFTFEGEDIVQLILGTATSEERAYLICGERWISTCISILQKEKYEIFDRLLKVLCKSEEEMKKFKEHLDIFDVTRNVCCYFLSYSKIDAIKSLINWMSFQEHVVYTLKENIIFSENGVNHCRKLLSSRRYKDFEEFIHWFLPSKEREIVFKKHLATNINEDLPINRRFSFLPVKFFTSVIVPEFISSFTRSKLPNVHAIRRIQPGIADTFGHAVCEDLIAGSSFQIVYEEEDSSVHVKTEFSGGQWERVDKFLRWSLPTKKKVLEFKKIFFEETGDVIHHNLIKAKQWKEAKRLFDWLGLTVAEIKDLKGRALFQGCCWWPLHYLVFDHEDKTNNLKEIDLLLRWHLTDKEAVIEFRDYFFDHHEDCDEAGLENFNMLIENYLDDLDQEDIGQSCRDAEERFFSYIDGVCFKRKSSMFLHQKKLRLSSDGEEVLQKQENC